MPVYTYIRAARCHDNDTLWDILPGHSIDAPRPHPPSILEMAITTSRRNTELNFELRLSHNISKKKIRGMHLHRNKKKMENIQEENWPSPEKNFFVVNKFRMKGRKRPPKTFKGLDGVGQIGARHTDVSRIGLFFLSRKQPSPEDSLDGGEGGRSSQNHCTQWSQNTGRWLERHD